MVCPRRYRPRWMAAVLLCCACDNCSENYYEEAPSNCERWAAPATFCDYSGGFQGSDDCAEESRSSCAEWSCPKGFELRGDWDSEEQPICERLVVVYEDPYCGNDAWSESSL